MDVVGFLVRTQLRRQWRRVVALSVLVALVGGVVIASTLGAERSRTSLSRFVDAVDAADIGLFVGAQEELDPVADHPDIVRMARFSLPALFPTAVLESDDVFIPFAAFTGGEIPYEFNGYRVLQGRMPDAGAATEIALDESTATLLDVEVGGRVEMAMFTPEELEQVFGYGDLPASYETIEMDVVAVMRDPLDVIARPTDIVVTPLTPAAAEQFADLGSIGEGAFVGLRDGADVEAFTTDVAEVAPEAEIERWIGGTEVSDTGFGSTLDLIANGLLAVAVVVGVAGLVAVGQAFARAASASQAEDGTLEALGLGRRRRRLVRAAPSFAVVGVGAVGAGVVALAVSPRFPVGVARRAEPDPGVDLHPGILLGAVLVLVAGCAVATASTAFSGRRHRFAVARGIGTLPTRDPVARVVGSGNAALARSTQAAVAFGGLAVAAALVFAASLGQLLDSPRQYGWSFDAAVVSETNNATTVDEGVDVAADPAVAEAAEALFQIQVSVDDVPSLGYAIGVGSGSIEPVVARGRAPAAGDEVALGRETLRQVGVDIGDDVTIDGGAGPATFRVVGQAIIPVSADGGRVGNGATFVTQALPALGVDGPMPASRARATARSWCAGRTTPISMRRPSGCSPRTRRASSVPYPTGGRAPLGGRLHALGRRRPARRARLRSSRPRRGHDRAPPAPGPRRGPRPRRDAGTEPSSRRNPRRCARRGVGGGRNRPRRRRRSGRVAGRRPLGRCGHDPGRPDAGGGRPARRRAPPHPAGSGRARSQRNPPPTDAGPAERVMAALLYWVRSDLRDRRWGAVGLALLVTVAMVVPFTAAAAARRTDSALPRMRSELQPAHGDVQFEEDEAPPGAIATIAAIPGVEHVGEGVAILAHPLGSELDSMTIHRSSGWLALMPSAAHPRQPCGDSPTSCAPWSQKSWTFCSPPSNRCSHRPTRHIRSVSPPPSPRPVVLPRHPDPARDRLVVGRHRSHPRPPGLRHDLAHAP